MSDFQHADNSALAKQTTDEPRLTPMLALALVKRSWALLTFGPIAAGLLALGATYLVPPTFTASTTFIPPQQGQNSAAAALASLGTLASLAGAPVSTRSSADQIVSLLSSVSVSDRIVDQFGLLDAYGKRFRVDARRALANNVRITLGKRDGLITLEVDDHSPQRAADMANRYVEELRRITSTLAVTEAQQRRAFFEQQLKKSRDRLVSAQQALQSSGYGSGALKAEPRAAADSYAKLKAEVASAEIRLNTLRGSLTDSAPEVRQQLGTLVALREQLSKLERASNDGSSDYVSKYRDFKYEEAMMEVYARQFELARLDESKEGALIQVVDPAQVPELKSRPKRLQAAAQVAAATAALALLFVAARHLLRSSRPSPTR